jgi:hypothetical protein
VARKKPSLSKTAIQASSVKKELPSYASPVVARLWSWRGTILPISTSQDLQRLHLRRLHRGSAEGHSLLTKLDADGIDSAIILKILYGKCPPNIDLFDLHCKWALAAQAYSNNVERQQAIIRLTRQLNRFRNVDTSILESPLFSQPFKNAVKEEFQTIRTTLQSLTFLYPEDESAPLHPFTVRLFDPRKRRKGSEDSEWSRHRFWSSIILALRAVWKNAGKTDYQAFKDIARLLSLFFSPFPDKPALVRNRFYHASR